MGKYIGVFSLRCNTNARFTVLHTPSFNLPHLYPLGYVSFLCTATTNTQSVSVPLFIHVCGIDDYIPGKIDRNKKKNKRIKKKRNIRNKRRLNCSFFFFLYS